MIAPASNSIAETLSATTTVESVWDGRDVMVSHELYRQLKLRVGVLTLTNCQTRSIVQIHECISNKWLAGSDRFENLGRDAGGASVVISQQIAKQLALVPGSQVHLANALTMREVVLYRCGEDISNTFGFINRTNRSVRPLSAPFTFFAQGCLALFEIIKIATSDPDSMGQFGSLIAKSEK